MSSQNGFINLFRSIENHWIFDNPSDFKMWVQVLLRANFANSQHKIGSNIVTVKPGQILKSLRVWSVELGVSVKTVSKFFDLLESEDMIKVEIIGKGKHKKTLISIENWEVYQGNRKHKIPHKVSHEIPHKIPHEVPHEIPHLIRSKEYKNLKKERVTNAHTHTREDENDFYQPPEEPEINPIVQQAQKRICEFFRVGLSQERTAIDIYNQCEWFFKKNAMEELYQQIEAIESIRNEFPDQAKYSIPRQATDFINGYRYRSKNYMNEYDMLRANRDAKPKKASSRGAPENKPKTNLDKSMEKWFHITRDLRVKELQEEGNTPEQIEQILIKENMIMQ